ncbi:MAG: hypothetical protein M1827_006620 [Pycnora praestabilis]|nr:MAG: hypothetical protein M1827_006620 [Pycnora praestabilis]
MGKAGRFACIFAPFALTLASLICIVLVGLGGTNKSSTTLANLYFFKADTSNFTLNTNVLPGTDLDSKLVQEGLNATKSALNLKDFYTVSLWNYCDGDKVTEKGGAVDEVVSFCSPRQANFWFNPVEVWGLNGTGIEEAFPKTFKDALDTYQTVSHWMYIAYIVAFIATIVEIVVGFFAIFSRWGSFATTIVSTISSIFILGASITATVLFSILAGDFNSLLKTYGIHGSLGGNMFATTWLAVVFSWGAGLFWLFSVCCCSGRSPHSKDNKRVKVEKTPYTYERVGSPVGGHGVNNNGGQRSSNVPLMNIGGKNNNTAYEPFRQEQVASAGAHIILLVRNLSSPQTLSIRTAVQTLGRICHLYECDLTDRKAVAEVVPRICERDGRSVDVLVNCGGVQHRAPAVDFPDEMWDQIIQVNLSSAFVLSRALARHWFSLSPSTNPATSTKKIINIASVLTFTGSAQIPAYVATKGAIGQLTKALSNEWMSKGICVNAIAPGYIATELTEGIRGDVEKERHVLERVPVSISLGSLEI